MALSVGDRLGPYRILGGVGKGGMGEVYRARDTRLKREVAVKVLSPNLAEDRPARERFRREALAVSALNHPNVCMLFDVGREGDLNYLVMELLRGESLASRLGKGPLPLERILRYGLEIADALGAAHSAGIIHRDIKPANIFVTDRDHVKVLDFGLAKPALRAVAGALTAGTLTQPGWVMGTVAYMSPEQAMGEEVDCRADLFSFGAVLYEMCTGAKAFQGDSQAALAGILTRMPRNPAELNPDLPAGLIQVVTTLLAKRPEHRFQTATEVLTALGEIRQASELKTAAAAKRSWPKRMVWTGAALFLAAAGAAAYRYVNPPPILTSRDSIVLADFANNTGEPAFDEVMRQAAWLKLAESPYLRVLSDDQMSRTLQLMRRPRNAVVTEEVARDICRRNALKAVITGSISSIPKGYFVQLIATNCATGETLARSGDDASSKSGILRATRKASVDLRGKLGESLKSIQKYDKPLELTTSSFEALRAYSMARKSRRDGKRAEQLAWLRRAVELDPNFAYGYAALSVDAWNRHQRDQAAEYARRAFDLREQVTEREKFYIIDKYYGNATGQLEEQIQSDKMWASVYPRDYSALASLCTAYGVAGQYDKALQAALDAIAIDPDAVTPYGNAMGYYAALGRLDDAKRIYEEARKREIAYGHLPVYYYDVAFLLRDEAAKQQAVADSIKNDAEDEISLEMALAAAYDGKLHNAELLIDRAIELARNAKNEASMARAYATRAHVEAMTGFTGPARTNAAAAARLASSPEILATAGWVFARTAEFAQAEAIEKQLQERYPLHTIVNRVFLPVLRAEMEFSRNRPQQAIEALETAVPYERTSTGETRNLYAIYLRGQSYLLARQGQAAMAEFQKIIHASGIIMNSPLTPLSRLGVARAYAVLNDTVNSRAAYEYFFIIWNQADSGLPIIEAARREYAVLR